MANRAALLLSDFLISYRKRVMQDLTARASENGADASTVTEVSLSSRVSYLACLVSRVCLSFWFAT
jgi:hypothetical protein